MTIIPFPRKKTLSGEDRAAMHGLLAQLRQRAAPLASALARSPVTQAQYFQDIDNLAAELDDAVGKERLTAARAVAVLRQLDTTVEDLARGRGSLIIEACVRRFQAAGPLAELGDRYAARVCGRPFSSLVATQQAAVFRDIVRSTLCIDPSIKALAEPLDRAGKRVLFVSLALGLVHTLADPSQLGYTDGRSADALAPALIGGVLAAISPDLAFHTAYVRAVAPPPASV